MTTISRALAAIAAVTLILGASASAMAAAQRNVPAAVTPQAVAGCGGARVCALITGAGGLSRAKNVNKVTHPTTGVYCVTPKAGVLTLSQVTPLTTIEWGSSSGNNLLAMYSDSKLNCPASTLEFHTFDTFGNATNGASFFIVVN